MISCTESNDYHEIVDQSNSNIQDILKNTTADTIFYYRNSEIIVGEIHRAKYHNDDIYLIDKSANQIVSFTADGDLVQHVGRYGRGPGEYLEPVALTIFDDNLVVLDRSLNRISQFIFDEAAGKFSVLKSAVHDFYMTDICEVDGRIWVYGYKEGKVVHQLSSDLEQVERSGGELSAYDQETIWDIARNGTIACGENYIYSAFMHDNAVHVYSRSDLSLSDKITFDDIVPIQYSIVEHNGRYSTALKYYQGVAYNEKGNFHDGISNLTVVDNTILAQYVRHYQDYRPISPKLVSFIIEKGNHTYKMFDDYPHIYDFSNGNYLTVIQDSVSFIVNRKHM